MSHRALAKVVLPRRTFAVGFRSRGSRPRGSVRCREKPWTTWARAAGTCADGAHAGWRCAAGEFASHSSKLVAFARMLPPIASYAIASLDDGSSDSTAGA
jgi:hypothetical protein